MELKYLNNKRIAILGLGVENYAMLKFLFGKVKGAQITVCDKRSKQELGKKYQELGKRARPVRNLRKVLHNVGITLNGNKSFKNFDDFISNGVNWVLGEKFNKNLYQYDILFRAPGWPISCPGIREATHPGATRHPASPAGRPSREGNKKTILYSPIRLFFDLCPSKNIIGVTGTKGKGTTSSLIHEIIRQAGKRVWLGGNIGIAPFEFIKKIKDNDWVVLELSSFQLEDLETSPRIAVVTNFYREHLRAADPHNPNFHQSLNKYWQAKLNIFKWQRPGNLAILNRRLASKTARKQSKGQTVYFTKSTLASRLPGEHNRENIAAAETVARLMNIRPAIIAKAVARFKGLEHRLEMAREIKGVKYFNDSFSTTPESTIIALKSFKGPIVLLAGGADKGANFKGLAAEIKKRVKFIILFKGAATPRLEKELRRIGYARKQIKVVNDMKAAVRLAKEKIGTTGTVIMSPACASFGLFKNYKERGRLFKQAVNVLK